MDHNTRSTYTLTVRATDPTGAYDSATVSVTVEENLLPLAPIPSNVGAGSPRAGSVLVSWNSRSGVSTYRVEYRQGSSGTWTTATSSATGTNYRVTGLTCNTSYQFRVSGYGNGTTYRADWGSASGAKAANTNACALPKPPAPDGLTTGPITKSSIQVSWNEITGISKYKLEYRQASSGSWTTFSDAVTTLGQNSNQLVLRHGLPVQGHGLRGRIHLRYVLGETRRGFCEHR